MSITVISWSVAALMQGYAFTPDWAQLATSVLTLCVVPLAVFVGLATAANERSRRTMAFLQSLPVPMWRVAIWKLLLGIVTCTTPILLAVVLCYIWHLVPHSARSTHPVSANESAYTLTGTAIGDLILSGTLCALSLFIWTAATSVNSKDEVRAGALSLAIWSAGMCFYCSLVLVFIPRWAAETAGYRLSLFLESCYRPLRAASFAPFPLLLIGSLCMPRWVPRS